MKYAGRLKFLFSIVAGLLICIVSIELFNDPVNTQFYCGVQDPTYIQQSRSEQNVPLHDVGEKLFKENCKSCHKIHEVSVGPALSGITERRPKKWIYAFIQNSAALINKKDTMAINLFNKYNKAEMTAFHSLTKPQIDSILIYIESSEIPVQSDIPLIMY
jgi:cytochrome c2